VTKTITNRIECYASFLADHVKGWLAFTPKREFDLMPEDIRPVFALALEALEREGKIPGAAPELREIGEGGALAELRGWLRREEIAKHDEVREYEGDNPRADGARRQLTGAIQELDRIAAKHRPSPRRPANDLQGALRLQGVDLGPDATAEVVRALESLEGETS
jgi:hypothetical protein